MDKLIIGAIPHIYSDVLYFVDQGKVMEESPQEEIKNPVTPDKQQIGNTTKKTSNQTTSAPKLNNQIALNDSLAIEKEHIVLLPNQPSTDEFDLLKKILLAARLPLSTIGVISAPAKQEIFLDATINVKSILFFGVKPFEFGFKDKDFPSYEVKESDNVLLLVVDQLNKIAVEPRKKQALWIALQRMYKL